MPKDNTSYTHEELIAELKEILDHSDFEYLTTEELLGTIPRIITQLQRISIIVDMS